MSQRKIGTDSTQSCDEKPGWQRQHKCVDELKVSYSEIKVHITVSWRGHTLVDTGLCLKFWTQFQIWIGQSIGLSSRGRDWCHNSNDLSGSFHSWTWGDLQSNISPDCLLYLMMFEDLRSNTPPGGFGISKLVRSRSSILRRGGAQMLSFSLIRTFATHHSLLHTSFPLDPSFFNRNQTFS